VITVSAEKATNNHRTWHLTISGTGGHAASAISHGLGGSPMVSIYPLDNLANAVSSITVNEGACYITVLGVTVTPGTQVPHLTYRVHAMYHTITE